MCARITDMRGVDLSTFQFDWDLTFAAFFLNAQGRIYSRFYGRDAFSAMSHQTMDGLQAAMQSVLEIHAKEADDGPEDRPPARWKKVDDIPAFRESDNGRRCIHCHKVNEFARIQAADTGAYSKEMIRVWAPPENWGIKLDLSDGSRIESVAEGSFAEAAGLRAGDRLKTVNGTRILAQGDLFFAMNFTPERGEARVVYERKGEEAQATLKLDRDWKASDISWRKSVWRLGPKTGMFGADIGEARKKKLGIAADALAFELDEVKRDTPADAAGLQAGDLVTAVGPCSKAMNAKQFQGHFRLEYNPGDKVEIAFRRDGREQKAALTLSDR